MGGTFSFPTSQLGGGLDVQGIVSQLLQVERQPINRLEQEQSRIQRKINAFEDFQSKLLDLETKIGDLSSADSFSKRSASSSNENLLRVTADSAAIPGSFSIEIERLARSDNFVTDSTFASTDTAIGTGSFDLSVGTETVNISIDSGNNTLTGLKNAINDSGADVVASIVNDGSGFRLTVTSNQSGSDSAISISDNTLGESFSRTHQNVASAADLDASLTVNGLQVTSSSNSVSGVVPGVTLDLSGTTEVGQVVTVSVENDTEAVKDSIQAFVDSFNDTAGFINSQFTFVQAAGTAGLLSSEGLVRRAQLGLSEILRTNIEGLPGEITNLRALGVDVEQDGTLSIDSERLDENLENNFDQIQDLFLTVGQTSNPGVSFVTAGSQTGAGTFEVNITQVAEAATVTAPNAFATLDVDETLTFTLGENTSVVNLTNGQTLSQVVDAINAQLASDNVGLTASESGGQLVINSNQQGSAVSFTVVSDQGAGQGTGISTTGLSDAGLDVEGFFRDTESGEILAAGGNGNVLRGSEGDVSGLSVSFSGTTTGVFGTVDVSVGISQRFEDLLHNFTDEFDGSIQNTVERLNERIRDIDDNIANFEQRLILREEQLIAEFSRADQALRELASLQSQIASQSA